MNILPELGFIDEPADPGIMYRTLRHLEEYGLVISEWDTSGAGPAKRRYTITEAGKEQLKLWSETLRRREQAIGEFLKKVDHLLSK
ncbi:helix-turn-helix transcriptional regulator [candidate division KSB1 bacterium]|nr:helix-turn-helix transcriptional regulator [candidate division KSB1 bacterium]